jgi:hypothetical protein
MPSVVALEIRGETDWSRATTPRALHDLPNRLHDVGDDRVVHVNAL